MWAIAFSGAPASGKDTQAQLLLEWFQKNFPKNKVVKIVSSEEILKFFKKGPKKIKFLGKTYFKEKEIKKFYSGQLVSFGFISKIIEEKIKNIAKKNKSIILVGSPRSQFEARVILKNFKKYYGSNFVLIYLKVREKTIYERSLKRKRKEGLDVKEKIKIRIKEFKKNVLPAILIFKKAGHLLTIDGEPEIAKIHQDIINKLGNYLRLK